MIIHDINLIFIPIPFTEFDIFDSIYSDSFDLVYEVKQKDIPDMVEEFAATHTFSAIVRNPYERAFLIWDYVKRARKKFKKDIPTIGELFEGAINGIDWYPDYLDLMVPQTKYLHSTDGIYLDKVDIDFHMDMTHVFRFEELTAMNLIDINEFFTSIHAPQLRYFCTNGKKIAYGRFYDQISIEAVEYVFADDFDEFDYKRITDI